MIVCAIYLAGLLISPILLGFLGHEEPECVALCVMWPVVVVMLPLGFLLGALNELGAALAQKPKPKKEKLKDEDFR